MTLHSVGVMTSRRALLRVVRQFVKSEATRFTFSPFWNDEDISEHWWWLLFNCFTSGLSIKQPQSDFERFEEFCREKIVVTSRNSSVWERVRLKI